MSSHLEDKKLNQPDTIFSLVVFDIRIQWSTIYMIGKGKCISQGLYVQLSCVSSENSTDKLF